MKRAKITAKNGYRCAPDGHTVVTIPCGTVVEGKIAEWALADRAASAMFDPREKTAQNVPTETKATMPKPPRKRGK